MKGTVCQTRGGDFPLSGLFVCKRPRRQAEEDKMQEEQKAEGRMDERGWWWQTRGGKEEDEVESNPISSHTVGNVRSPHPSSASVFDPVHRFAPVLQLIHKLAASGALNKKENLRKNKLETKY